MASRGQKSAASRRANARHQEQLRRLNAILKRLPAEVRQNVRKEIGAAASAITSDARSRAPVLTGNLRKSINWRFGDTAKIPHTQGNVGGETELSAVVFAGGDFTRYAHLVEFGTQSAPAQPYFYPAIRANKRQIDDAMAGAMKRAIRGARRAK